MLGEKMARSQRVHYNGAFYHVMLRGNDGNDIFFTRKDGIAMCFLLQQGIERYGHRPRVLFYEKPYSSSDSSG
jgi:hypothetical protein